MVDVNRAVAVGMAGDLDGRPGAAGPLAADRRLAGYDPLHAARAELLRRAGDRAGADAAFEAAIERSANAVERDELERRRAQLAEAAAPDR